MTDVRGAPVTVPWSLWRLCRFVFHRVVRAPIAAGRLKDNGWPPGLKGIVAAWIVLYVTMAGAAAFGTAIRSHSALLSDSTTTLPVAALPLVTVAYTFALTCLYTAGLHLAWWLRVPITLVVVAFLLRLTDFSAMWPTDVATIVAAGLLVVLLVVRWGRAFHWLEFVLALAVIGHGVLVEVILAPRSFAGFAVDERLNALMLLAGFAWSFALPAGLVAGAAMAELTISTVAWTVTGVWQAVGSRRRWSPARGVAALLVLFVLRGVQIGWDVWQHDTAFRPAILLPGAAIFAVVLGACALIMWRSDRVRGGDPPLRPDPDDLTGRWSGWSTVLGVLFGATIGVPIVAYHVLTAFGLRRIGKVVEYAGGQWQFEILVLAAAGTALCVAFVRSRRGERVVPLILTAAGAWWICTSLPDKFDLLASEEGMTVAATLAAFGVFVWLLVRRRLTAVRGVALATIVVLTGVLTYRDILEEPLTAVFSLVGVGAAILAGLVWRLLTDSGYSRGDSRRFPRPSRVLVALASTTYAVTSIGVVSLVGGEWPYDLNLLESSGDIALGLGFACAAFFAGLSLAARGRIVRSDPPRDDYGKLLVPPSSSSAR